MNEQFCFSCGREVPGPAVAGEAAICDRCRARHDPEAKTQLFVRRVGNPEEGPLSRESVEDQLGRGLLGPEDRVREEDGPWSRLDQHAWFAGFFVAGDPRNERLLEVQRAREAEQDKLRRKGALHKGLRFFMGAGGVFAVAGGLLSIPMFMADQRVQDVAAMGGEAVDQAVLTTRKAMDDDAAVADLAQTQGLPGQGLVEALQAREDLADVVAAEAVERGLTAMMDGSQQGIAQARGSLEAAVAQEPKDVAALASLAWAYAASADAALQARSAEALDRAVALDQQAPSVDRARAGLALEAASPKQALTHAEACLAGGTQDGVCLWLQGRALAQLGQGDKAQESLDRAQALLPESFELRLGLSRAALDGLRLDLALPLLKACERERPDHAGTQRSLAQVYALGGEPSKALKYANKALKTEADNPTLRLEVAALQLERGQGAQALRTLDPLLAGTSPSEDTLLIAGWAAMDARKTARAAELADQLLLLTPSSARAHLLATAIADRRGDAQALASLTGAKPDLMGPAQAARYYLAVAERMRSAGELREAEDAVRLALERRPAWVMAQVALAEILLESGNTAGATQLMAQLWKAHPDPDRPFVVGLPMPSSRYAALEAGLKAVPAGNPQHGPAREALATLQAVQCVDSGRGCPDAQLRLGVLLEEDPSLAGPGVWLAQVALKVGNPAMAMETLQAKIAEQGTLANLLLLRGQAKAGVRGNPQADLNDALGRATGQLGLRGQVAAALLQAGQTDAAVEAARKALQQDSDDLEARRTLLAVGEKGR